MVLVPPTSPSWTWIRLIKTCSLLLKILLKSTWAHVSWRSPLKASLNFLAISLVTGPTGISNGSFDGWIASGRGKEHATHFRKSDPFSLLVFIAPVNVLECLGVGLRLSLFLFWAILSWFLFPFSPGIGQSIQIFIKFYSVIIDSEIDNQIASLPIRKSIAKLRYCRSKN